jgi:hypothetical protein
MPSHAAEATFGDSDGQPAHLSALSEPPGICPQSRQAENRPRYRRELGAVGESNQVKDQQRVGPERANRMPFLTGAARNVRFRTPARRCSPVNLVC